MAGGRLRPRRRAAARTLLCVAPLLAACTTPQPIHCYEGAPLPRSETSLIAVQADDNVVKLRIEAVDGTRLPGAEREFHQRNRAAIVRPGPHTIEVRGWYIADVGPDVVLPEGDHGNLVLFYTFGPRRLEFAAFAGRDYEVRARRVDIDVPPRTVRAPLLPGDSLLLEIVELPGCAGCPDTPTQP